MVDRIVDPPSALLNANCAPLIANANCRYSQSSCTMMSITSCQLVQILSLSNKGSGSSCKEICVRA
ncbi:cyclin-dependent kinases regulatory subunit [Iris pallida]|uniref:Cyclin-dependent kinases regulatory subunit n=1 Tax=Iris pallida TaxID=29817 RepID=A0AAX6IK94_IRIPA|nr:cyclin-dependent kinases regulatory subunit [Iris pallida]